MWMIVVLRRRWRGTGRKTFGLVVVVPVDFQRMCRIGQMDCLSLLGEVEEVRGFVVAAVVVERRDCWTWLAGVEGKTGIPSMR